MPPQGSKAKHWCFTLNNYTQGERVFDLAPYEYIVIGLEVGEKGTPHFQGYLVLKERQRLSAVKKLWPRAHLFERLGTPERASDYCKKGEQTKAEWDLLHETGPNWGKNVKILIEDGILPLTGGQKTKANYAETRKLAMEGRLDEIDASHYIRHYTTLKRIAQDHRPVPSTMDYVETPNLWIWGPTGSGKSTKARALLKDPYIKMQNKWWESYADEPHVLLEDLGTTHIYLGDHLKIWADRFGFRAEIKLGSCVLRPKMIIVTSNYSIEDLFKDPNVRAPLQRRFKEIYVGPSMTASLVLGSTRAIVI